MNTEKGKFDIKMSATQSTPVKQLLQKHKKGPKLQQFCWETLIVGERLWKWYGDVQIKKDNENAVAAKHKTDHIAVEGGRTWQPFVGSKNGNENFRQARIYNFCVKCVVFARNRKFAKLTQWKMQYIPCNSALLAQETLFLTQKGTFFAQRSPKSA